MTEYDTILQVIARFKDGASIAMIMQALDGALAKRTLQYRLSSLKSQGLIVSKGGGRSLRYYAVSSLATSKPAVHMSEITLSRASFDLRKIISMPLSSRKPVTYHREFLWDYSPNQTFYLSQSMRQHLHEIGQQSESNQPAATFAHKILDRLLIDLSWNSSRLEGNTYSLLETERLIHQGKAGASKDLFETRMILNHKAAIEFLVELTDQLEFNRYIILNLHALLSKNLLTDLRAQGRLRTIPVGIGKTVYTPLSIPQLIEEAFHKILETANAIRDPFEQSFFCLVHLPYLQPFVDVNKRVSRLACNIPLIKNNLCPVSFIDVSLQSYIDGILGVYDLNKIDLLADVYLYAYERSTLRYSEARNYLTGPDPFLEKYDELINALVHQIVKEKRNKAESVKLIRVFTDEQVEQVDRPHFIEVVETELLSLHEGNIAQFDIEPNELIEFLKIWQDPETM